MSFVMVLELTACKPQPEPATTAPVTSASSSLVAVGNSERGKYLASIFACMDCHSVRGSDGVHLAPDTILAGGQAFPGPWGVIYSVNLTDFAPKERADDLETIIRGREDYLYAMPTYAFNSMAKADMRDLIAYLHTLELAEVDIPDNQLKPDFVVPPPNQAATVPEVAPSDPVARGNYLVLQAACHDCHTPHRADGLPDLTRPLIGGGMTFPGPTGGTYTPPNLTPDPETGLGTWTDAQIADAIRKGVAADGHQLNPMMPYASAFHAYSDEDIAAVIAYLRSLPPVHNPLPENPVWGPAEAR